MKKEKEMFSLGTHYGGRVDQVGFVVKDVEVNKKGNSALVFFTFKLKDMNIEAQMPLEDSSDFKKHILAIIDQAISLKKEQIKNKKK